MIYSRIAGTGRYLPEKVLTNFDLEKMVDTSDEWITTRTGIKERRVLKGDDQGTSVIGIAAVNGLLEKTGTDPREIDLLICATTTPDMLFPATGKPGALVKVDPDKFDAAIGKFPHIGRTRHTHQAVNGFYHFNLRIDHRIDVG